MACHQFDWLFRYAGRAFSWAAAVGSVLIDWFDCCLCDRRGLVSDIGDTASQSAAILPGKRLLSVWLNLWQHPAFKFGLPVLCLAISGYYLAQLKYDDDIRQLQAMPATLKQQEALITQVSGMQASQQMLVVSADSDEALMQRLESLELILVNWQKERLIKGHQSLAQYLGSNQRQQQDFSLISHLYQTQGPALAAGLQLTKVPELQAEFAPITLAQYLSNPVSEPIRFLHLGEIEGKSAAVITLNEVKNLGLVQAFAQSQADVTYLTKQKKFLPCLVNTESKSWSYYWQRQP